MGLGRPAAQSGGVDGRLVLAPELPDGPATATVVPLRALLTVLVAHVDVQVTVLGLVWSTV